MIDNVSVKKQKKKQGNKPLVHRSLWMNVIKSIASTLLMGIGINLFISCELGSDPMSVFLDGFHRLTGVDISVTDQVINMMLLLIGILCNRKLIGINTIINVLVLGICIQIPNILIEPLQLGSQSIWVRMAAMVAAQLVLATSFAWMQTFEKGISSIDVVFFYIIDKTHLDYRTIRVIYDAVFMISGCLFGGIVGIGTIFSLLTNGYFVQKIRKSIDVISNRKQKGSLRNERKYS